MALIVGDRQAFRPTCSFAIQSDLVIARPLPVCSCGLNLTATQCVRTHALVGVQTEANE